MVRFSTVLAVLTLLPALLFIAIGTVRSGADPDAWFVVDDGCPTDIPALVAFILWLYVLRR